MNKAFSISIAILLPFILLMAGVRLIMTPSFPQLEYARPGFPADPFGMSTTERNKWSAYAVDYLVNDAEISYLGELKFADGSPLYAPSELEHMVDVKEVVQGALTVWYLCLGIAFALSFWLLIQGQWRLLRRGINMGGWLSMGLIALMLLYLAFNFNSLFDQFHRIFFQEGSWVFNYSDTLIRLFPLEFWRDGFILAGAFTFFAGGLLVLLTRGRRKVKPAGLDPVPPTGY